MVFTASALRMRADDVSDEDEDEAAEDVVLLSTDAAQTSSSHNSIHVTVFT